MSRPRATGGDAGFTLVELLVVIGILATVVTVGAIGLGAARNRQIAETTRAEIVAALKLTRLRAIQTGDRTSVVFDPDGRRITGTGRPPIAIDPRVSLKIVSSSKVDETGKPAIVFLSDGRSSGGAVELTMDADHRRIVVDWLTGTVREEGPG